MGETVTQQNKFEKLKELGLLCYNFCVDGMAFPGEAAPVIEVKSAITRFFAERQNSANEAGLLESERFLNEKLIKLGSSCCEMYQNGEYLNEEITVLCRDICLESRASWTPIDTGANYRKKEKQVQSETGNTGDTVNANNAGNANNTQQIPVTVMSKVCTCGAENAPDSNFCVMCGNRLA